MYIVQNISAYGKQKQRLVLPDGTSVTVRIEYKPLQLGWFFVSIEYEDFFLENVRICTSPNLLHQFKNQIPFGIGISSINNFEPTQQQDFSSGNSKMYVLTSAEVEAYSEYLSSG